MEDQLILVYDDVSKWVDDGFIVDVALFDYSKAFDVVNHRILLDKLYSIGIKGQLLHWIREFLTNRSFSVTVSGHSSKSWDVLSGVPQGSVLGPLLFLIYINFLPEYIQAKCKFFADDLKIYMKIRSDLTYNTARDLSSFQGDIDKVQLVSSLWGLNLNPSKCVVLRFGRGSKDFSDVGVLSHYYLQSSNLNLPESHMDLDILVDTSMKFHIHVRSVVAKASGFS